ncbi:CamS family sex pheromone protein [Alteribacillus bidgolensis]|uniref:Protein involved in sex pheromone biosynthesis n=1 Tax=Alteribacillus bidgolensis TaxID=930129 RepID=A0A1G8KCT2_9BACI|nr:CamS family sex pheromone protein [Alteribacillus bidgolensis]SDI41214.1 Protein involved in sex pheromone biosynthesis [Alteribacillus bidgolensis]
MWKNTGMIALSSLLLLSGCLPGLEPDDEGVDIDQDDEEEADVEVSPEIPSLDNYYRSILQDGQFIHGVTRGFNTDIVYNRMDLERMEVGMQEIASEEFNQNEYFFREGQFINRNELNSWLMREKEGSEEEEGNPDGLNPPLGSGESFEEQESSQPRVLSNILEHNYVFENEEGNLQVGGLVIGLSMNSVYYFREQNSDGTYGPWLNETINEQTSLEEGKNLANEVLERLRNEERAEGALSSVPIMFAIFREAPRDSTVPGEFIATAVAPPEEGIGDWQSLNEKHYLFPSNNADEEQRDDAEAFNQFRNDVNQFFENYVGVVGEGYYQNDELRSLSIEIPITFYSKTEIIALTQHVTDRLEQRFPDELEIEVKISSTGGEEALVVKEPGKDPFIHVY